MICYIPRNKFKGWCNYDAPSKDPGIIMYY